MMREKRPGTGRALAGLLVCPILTLILAEAFSYNPFAEIRPVAWILNCIFYWIFAAFLLFLTGRLRLALRIQTVCFLLTGLANYYVIAFRSSPILPWDIFSVGTAASVADNFSYALPGRCWLVLAGFALLFLAEQLFPLVIERRQVRLAGVLASLLLLTGFSALLHQERVITGLGLYDKMFTPDVVQKRNGGAVAFLMELKYLRAQKPAGYDREACRSLLASYDDSAAVSAEAAQKPYPNIIVIMDEAFADMAYIGPFTPQQDYMPFFHSLQGAENTITGRLHVSVLGGNTANTEFEFLTGNTMAFLPQGSIPYQQYIRGSLPTLASYLREAGYQTVAMHPYYAKGWSRNRVYPWMGFEQVRFLEAYEGASYVRKYVSDASDFAQIIREYEQRDPEKPFLLFNVTMQNHGGYSQEFDNFTPEIAVDGIRSQPLANYLSLISLTDAALEELIAYFAQEEDTIIVFFGDHQPNDTVAAPIWHKNGVDIAALTPQQEALRYEVPYLIWANYEIAAAEGRETSANFLALEVLRQAGIPLHGYYRYLDRLQEDYPVISARHVLTSEGTALTDVQEDASGELLTYQKLQYYHLFDAGQ